MLNKLLNWFRRPKWEEFRDRQDATMTDCCIGIREGDTWFADLCAGRSWKLDGYAIIPKEQAKSWSWPGTVPEPQWRTNFSLTAAQRSERSRKAAATRKANKAKSNGE